MLRKGDKGGTDASPADVMVLDGNQRSSLAVTRSLGRRGIRVAVGEATAESLSGRSRFSGKSFRYPDPWREPKPFLETLVRLTENENAIVLLPMTDVTLGELLPQRDVFGKNVCLPFVSSEQFVQASDKAYLIKMAMGLGIPVPRTVFPRGYETVCSPDQVASLGFPIVAKPVRSREFREGEWVGMSVRYLEDSEALSAFWREEEERGARFLLQERIEGPGIGLFFLMQQGRVLARFAHRRIREKPPSGGVSVLCESIEPPDDALAAATTILKHLDWTGVAMVEFKRDKRDGIHKLIEVNARFWGSLQLAVSSGVDFPYLLYRMARGETVAGPRRYRVGLRMRWELGDLDHLLIRMRRSPAALSLPTDAPRRRTVLGCFVADFFRPSVKGEVLRPDDPGPFIFELSNYIRTIGEPLSLRSRERTAS